MPQEGLWDTGRQRRTFLMAVDMVIIPLGALVLVGSALTSSAEPWWERLGFVALGLFLVVGGCLWLRRLVQQGRKVNAVYGMKGAQRAGLLPPGPAEPGSAGPRDGQ